MRIIAAASLIVLIFTGSSPAQTVTATPSPGGFVEVDGSRLYYAECGSGQKAVVLLHDGVVNSAVWDDVWLAFCKQFHAIRYDRRGYGHSPATTAGLKGNPTGLLAHLDQSHFPVWGLLRNYRVLGYWDVAWPMRSSRHIGADGMGEVYKGRATRGWTGS